MNASFGKDFFVSFLMIAKMNGNAKTAIAKPKAAPSADPILTDKSR